MRTAAQCMLLTLFGASALLADAAPALDENRLWVPRTQQELKPDLVQAAQLADSSPGCEEVISGALDTERSKPNAPVFQIVCRNAAGYTYGLIVTNSGRPNAKVERAFADAADTKPGDNSATPPGETADDVIDDETASRNCLAALKTRTAYMTGLKLEQSDLQKLSSPEGKAQFEMDFDAADPSGMALHFHAVCRVSSSGTALVEVRPRKVEKPLSKPLPRADAPVKTDSAPAADANPESGKTTPKPEAGDTKAPADEDGWEVEQ